MTYSLKCASLTILWSFFGLVRRAFEPGSCSVQLVEGESSARRQRHVHDVVHAYDASVLGHDVPTSHMGAIE